MRPLLPIGLALLAGCASVSPCVSATGGGERFCVIVCPAGDRSAVECPGELPYRTETPRGPICRAEPGDPPAAVCAQIPGGCGGPAAPDYEATRATLAAEGIRFQECEHGLGLRWAGPMEPGARTESELTEENRAAILAAVALEGVEHAGWGVCCGTEGEEPPPLCVRVAYNRRDTDPVRLARALAVVLAPGPGRGAAAHLSPMGREGPRCDADQALCLPLARRTCDLARYDASAPRRTLDIGTTGGACAHDGECVVQGCGNGCVDWRRGHGAGTCEGYSLDEPTFCGCVEGACRWFQQ